MDFACESLPRRGGPAPSGGLRYSHDFSVDDVPDVIAARPDGALMMYPGNGRGGFLGFYPQIGGGFNTRDMIRHAQDFDRSGTRDLIARDPANGDLWLYRGNGSGGFSGQYVNGTGWNVFSEIVAPGDFDGDGNPDLVTVRINGDMNL
ncbi:MAG: FG-GAP repeat domain-containing protein, partial [Actinomycetes bacterium]